MILLQASLTLNHFIPYKSYKGFKRWCHYVYNEDDSHLGYCTV